LQTTCIKEIFLKKLKEIIPLATKFSKKKFNKKKLAKSLDNIASKVAKRNGYFFVKNQFNFYDILEQHTKQKIIVDIPFQRTASAVTKRLNTKDDTQNISVDRLQAKVQQFHKHYNDTVFYNHTLETSVDNFKKQVVLTRLDISITYLKHIKEDLINY
jgi:hypothetical protein